MTAKQVLFRSEAREKILRGATHLADAVRITLGPKSKSVIIQKQWGAPIVCNDGVTIAKVVSSPSRNPRPRRRRSRWWRVCSSTAACRRRGGHQGRCTLRVGHGGLALLRAIPALASLEAESTGDERTGIQILRRALEAPTRAIAENSAMDGGVVVDRMLHSTGNMGFDAARKEFVDLFDAGIIDPAKVVRIALENAVSVAGVLLLTEATMTEKKEKRAAPAETEIS